MFRKRAASPAMFVSLLNLLRSFACRLEHSTHLEEMMKPPRITSLMLIVLLGSVGAAAQQVRTASGSPFGLVEQVCHIKAQPDLKALSEDIKRDLTMLNQADAVFYFCLAERMERVGDYRASEFYEKAIEIDPTEPNYDLFFGDYLRNIRGAFIYPLFPQAEKHYFSALNKLKPEPERSKAEQQTYLFILRGLSALYERDGVALVTRNPGFPIAGTSSGVPVLSLASINRVSQAPCDLDREACIRDYTSEALYIQSSPVPVDPNSGVLRRPLTNEELSGLLRLQTAFETLDRLRIRYKTWPVIDLFYTHRQTTNNQVTNPFCITPTSSSGCEEQGLHPFNDLWLNTYGLSVQKPFNAFRILDFSVSGVIDGVDRRGLIPFYAGNNEHVMDYGVQVNASHFFGPDKGTATVGYTYQTIHPEITPVQPDRDRRFLNGTLDYQLFRPLPFLQTAYDRRFENRGWDFYAGFLHDTESYPSPIPSVPTDYVRRHDYFVGTSLRGVVGGRFDFTVQPTWFTSSVQEDPTQKNRQYETDASVLFRIVDEERNAGVTKTVKGLHVAFLHLVVPFSGDIAQVGLNAYENRKVGVQLDSKFFTYSRWTTFFASAGYDRVNFYQLNKSVNTFTVSVSMGF